MVDDIRQAFPIPMGPPGVAVSHMFTLMLHTAPK